MNFYIFLLHNNDLWGPQIPVIQHKHFWLTSISYKRIHFVHSNDVSSEHMQLYPPNITSSESKSLNKSSKIPPRSIKKQCSAITKALFGDNMCTCSTPNRTSSQPTITLSLQSNTIIVASLLSDGKADLFYETIGIRSRNGPVVLGYDTKAKLPMVV